MGRLPFTIAAALLLAACGGKEEPAPEQPAAPPVSEAPAPKQVETKFTPPPAMPVFTPPPAMPAFNSTWSGSSPGAGAVQTGSMPPAPRMPSSPPALPKGTPPPAVTPMPPIMGQNLKSPPQAPTPNPDGTLSLQKPQ